MHCVRDLCERPCVNGVMYCGRGLCESHVLCEVACGGGVEVASVVHVGVRVSDCSYLESVVSMQVCILGAAGGWLLWTLRGVGDDSVRRWRLLCCWCQC